uniref:Coiled-coil domain-containing protein 113-like n=1 Tax=Caenorhabditis tropicalis TaxID=1561998 RepID=A0A1I7TMY5_9PELO
MIENSFQNCFLNLKVADRVEALVSNVLEGQSKLETLKTSYQTGLKSHANTIVHVLFINNEADKSEVLQAHLQNLEEQVEALQELEDVDKIEVAWITLNESYEDFKNDDAKVSEQAKQLQLVRKRCVSFVREAQYKLEEYCRRIMIQAEEHRACKSSFDDNLSAEIREIKQSFTELLKNLFQQRRVDKLRVLVDEFDLVNREKCDKRVEAYQCSIRKRKFIMERVFRAEKELRSCQFKLKKVPYVHFESIADASKTITSSTAKLITMGNQYSQLNDSLKTDLEVSQRQKIVLDKKLSNLLQNTTKIQIELCDVIKKAIRQQIYRHDDLCCLTPEDFDACVR